MKTTAVLAIGTAAAAASLLTLTVAFAPAVASGWNETGSAEPTAQTDSPWADEEGAQDPAADTAGTSVGSDAVIGDAQEPTSPSCDDLNPTDGICWRFN